MKWWLKTFQNQALHHVINIFKKVNIKMLKVEIYTSEQATESDYIAQLQWW